MRLGLAFVGAALVLGAYTLVNTIKSRPTAPEEGAAPIAETVRAFLPDALEPGPEPRSYELIQFLKPDGSVGMVDDPKRVPPGAKILSRTRKTEAVPKRKDPAAEERLAGGRRTRPGRGLTVAEQALLDAVLESGVHPDAHELEQMEDELDAVERERRFDGQP